MCSLVENEHSVHVQQHPSQEKHRLTDKLYCLSVNLDMNVQAIIASLHHYEKEEKPPMAPSGLGLGYSDSR